MDVYAKLKADAYRPTIPYPKKPSRPLQTKGASPAELRTLADDLEQYEVDLAKYEAEKRSYSLIAGGLDNEFRADLRAYYDTVNYSGEQILYAKAYDDGHSAGFNEVAIHYGNLVEFLTALGVDLNK